VPKQIGDETACRGTGNYTGTAGTATTTTQRDLTAWRG
jgi:hypothetical protein